MDKGGVYQKKEWSIDTLDYLDESQMHHAEDKKKKSPHSKGSVCMTFPFIWHTTLWFQKEKLQE